MFDLNRVSQNTRSLPTTEGGDKHYVHPQTSPSVQWICYHNLNKKPSVQITDSAGSVVYGDIQIIDLNICILNFSAPFSGEAHFN